MGLDFGADDYVTKPFSVGELMARVRAALRRHGSQGNEAPLRFADLEIRAGRRQVLRDDAEIELTATEFDVLMALVEAHGRVLSRRQIMDRVWGSEHHGTARTVDNFLAQLRAKLERDPSQSRHLVTVRGVGYRFEAG
jgi:DNA-binding response OmpR family regulator